MKPAKENLALLKRKIRILCESSLNCGQMDRYLSDALMESRNWHRH